MDFKSALFIFLPFICQISAQSGSSFFYYYSPKQPMIINSQTFGTNPQSHQRLISPSSNSQFNFNLNPPAFHNQESQDQNPYRTETPFIPQRNAFPTVESIMDKIALTNAPAVAAQPPQFHHERPAAESPTSAFPGQPQPSAKLFNFLNQPFQFFQNSFNRIPPTHSTPSPPSHTYFMSQQQPERFTTANTPQVNNYDDQNQQHFYNYYSGPQPQPTTSYETDAPQTRNYNRVQSEPASYTNQYYSAKNAQGPTTSYSLTIGADPTTGPTATVHVSRGRPQSDVNRFQHPRLPNNYIPQRLNKNQEQSQDSPRIEEIAQNVEIEDIPIQDSPLEIHNSNNEDFETEMVITTTTKPGVVLMVITASEPTAASFTTTTTMIPETIPTTMPTTTSTNSTTTTTKPTIPDKVDDLKPPKRVIIRKKIARKRIRFFGKNRTATIPDTKPIRENVGKVEPVEQTIVTITTRPETSVETTTQKRVRTRTRITSTNKPELIETTTTLATTSVTSQSTDNNSQNGSDIPTTTKLEDHFYEPSTTPNYPSSTPTEVPFLTSAPEQITTTNKPITESTTKIPSVSSPSSDTYPVYDENDYEYYYNEGETPSSNEVHETPVVPNVQIESTPRPSGPSPTTTDKIESSVTEQSSTANVSEHEENSSEIPENMSEDEIIEPLSTTESNVISSESPDQQTTPYPEIHSDLNLSTSTEKLRVTTESIAITSTTTEALDNLKVSNPETVPDQINDKLLENFSSTGNVNAMGKTERSHVDYSDDPVPAEVGQIESNEPKSVNATEDAKSDAVGPEENEDFPDQYVYSQEEEYISDPRADEKIKEAQRQAHQNAVTNIRNRIQNATTTTTETPADDGLDNAKKFIRRPTDVTSFPSGASSSSSQNSYDDEEIVGDSRSQIIQKIQTFRTKLRRVASSRSVSSGFNTNSVRSTTKRPRRVTRPSDRSTSSTQATVVAEEEYDSGDNLGNVNEVISNSKVADKPEYLLKEPELPPILPPSPIVVEKLSSTNISNSEDSFANVNYDVNELEASNSKGTDTDSLKVEPPQTEQGELPNTKTEVKTVELIPEIEKPQNASLHVGELIILEILPTQSTTTEALSQSDEGTEASIENLDSESDFDENTDFQTYSMEDENESSTQKSTKLEQNLKLLNATSSVTFTTSTSEVGSSPPESIISEGLESSTTESGTSSLEAISSSTIEPSSETISVTSVSVETNISKSEVGPQRKVKVILKRKKGAPPGSGTVARQVVRTRTRLRPMVPAA